MDLSKSLEVFNPAKYNDPIHIVGVGSVGATVAENLARLGLRNIILWDFDVVEPHNIANQIFTADQIGKLKVEAVADIIKSINPDVTSIKVMPKGWNGEKLSGFVFMCVDSIAIRKEIVNKNKYSTSIRALFDFRTGLTFGQHYAADWGVTAHKEILLKTMDFTDEEAKAATPVSACNTTLSVCPTIRAICALGVANFMNFWNEEPIKTLILLDAFKMTLEAY